MVGNIDAPPGPAGAHAGVLARFGDPSAWSTASRCLFVAVIFATFTTGYLISLVIVARQPEFAPYIDQEFLPLGTALQAATLIAWIVLAGISLAARRWRPEAPGLVPVTLAVAAWELCYGSYFFGILTSVFAGLTIIASLAIGLILFDKRLILRMFALLATALIGLTVAEQLRLIPYAPLLTTSPFHDGSLHPSWLFNMGAMSAGMLVLIGFIVYFVIEQWRERGEALARTGEELARANDVISRYVASQLADQIQAGRFDALERHDRRRLTLFFSDIEGFSETADRMEPEALSNLLNDYLSEMTDIAERHGATIDKFVGDAIVIFFGAPVATSDRDHALRAVRMALEMQERMAALRRDWGADGIEQPFHVRMGINTGHASIGSFGSRRRMDYTAIGRQVNLAARLQAVCQRDRVLLSHSTWSLVRHEIPCDARGEIQVKGFHEPVTIYEVIASETET